MWNNLLSIVDVKLLSKISQTKQFNSSIQEFRRISSCARIISGSGTNAKVQASLLTCVNTDRSSHCGSCRIMQSLHIHILFRPSQRILTPIILGQLKCIDTVIRIKQVHISLCKTFSYMLLCLCEHKEVETYGYHED